MSERIYKNFNYLFIVLAGLLTPFFTYAKTDVDALWSDRYSVKGAPSLVFDTSGISDMVIFFVYLFIAIGAAVAFMTIFVGAIKLYTADEHEDDHYAAKYTFVSGIISFVVALALFFSLDYIFLLVGNLAQSIT